MRILHFRVYYSGGVRRWDMDTSEHRQTDGGKVFGSPASSKQALDVFTK